ncbi:hypothetical protein AM501_02900 [Aneurinibacillus migulanus]|uniref:GrpB family protein n=1 Tax=Aneurinibacillus migulanus TaxID=47500 RepID=UPI0005BD8BAC|nr:GrpB family protein [Aneurinibacillus migulanus]KIV57716.1 hypothetical protein TS64_06145 [Aneurinibacillus migulanus]KPD09695.1 hypothetical protein AM501_02900 [Aneurinibacillus migulanus]MCP1358330.1 GrpB family protein [Aneurinibacillus migulanus]
MTKKLTDLSLEDLWGLFPVKLESFNPLWKNWFEEEKRCIITTVGKENIERINHIGSTSVEGLTAKPTIDILLEITSECDIDKLRKNLEDIDYILEYQPQKVAPHLMGMKGYTINGFAERVFHLHIRYAGDWKELYFRDYLRENPTVATKYVELKTELKKKYEHDRDKYTDEKHNFVEKYSLVAMHEFPGRYLTK